MSKLMRILLAVVIGGFVGAAAHAGGRAHVTIVKAPGKVEAGQAFEVAFDVRPEPPMSRDRSIEPTVRAVCGDQVVTVAAVPLKVKGQFKAAVTLPSAGDWTIQVDSRYCETQMKPLKLSAAKARPTAS
jgi:hypothetical protein